MAFVPIAFTGGETGTIPNWIPGTASTEAKYTGNYGIVVGGNTYGYDTHVFDYGVSLNELYVTFWFCPKEYTIQEDNPFYFEFHLTDGNTLSIELYQYPRFYIGDTLLYTSSVALTGGWQNWKIGLKVAENGWFKMYLDNNLVIDYTGNTQPGSATEVNYFHTSKFLNNNYCSQWYDDIFIGTGGFPGNLKVLAKTLVSDAQKEFLNNGQSGLIIPTSAPTLSEGSSGVLNGSYKYKISFYDSDGETLCGPESSSITVSSKTVELSNIPLGGTGCTGRKIYRTESGGTLFKLLTTISNNTSTTYSDNTDSLGSNEPGWDNYSAIDEIPHSDSDYIWTDTNGKRSLFTLSSTNWANKVPICMNVFYRARKDSSNSQKIKLIRKLNSTIDIESSDNLSTSFLQYQKFFTTDPDGNSLTAGSIESMQIGIESEIPT
jgi:hypothetical protein